MLGTKLVLGVSLLGTGLLCCLVPTAASLGPWWLAALRFLQGLFESSTFPSLNPLVARWTPAAERGRFVSFIYFGGSVGQVVTFPLCGVIIRYLGWQQVFYITAAIAGLWLVAWAAMMTDLPEKHRWRGPTLVD